MAAGWCKRRVIHGRNGEFEQRPRRRPPVLGVVPGSLYVLNIRTDVHGGAVLRPRCTGHRPEFRQAGKGEVHLGAGPFDAEVMDRRYEFGIKIAPINQPQKRHLGVEIRGHRSGLDLLASFEHHSPGAAVTHHHLLNGRLRANHSAFGPRRSRDGFRDCAHTAAHEPPQPPVASHAAHAMVEQTVGSPRRTRPAISADHTVGRQRDLHLLGFEPLIQQFGRALGEDFDQRRQILGRQPAHLSGQLQIFEEIEGTSRRKRRRCDEQQGFHHPRNPLDLIFVGGIPFGVAAREPGDLG